jgi:hypothetical protein
MTVFTRRVFPFAACIALTATLSIWIAASASSPATRAAPLAPMHFKAITVSTHYSFTGKQPGVGSTIQQVQVDRVGMQQIGTDIVSCTVLSKMQALCQIAANFPGRGRIELQGALNVNAKRDLYPITGGTGQFATIRGWAVTTGPTNVEVVFR